MSNPWLNIPLDDYEGHMSLPAVGQAQMLAEQLDRALARWAPHRTIQAVSPSPYNTLDRLASVMTLVAPETLLHAALAAGFSAADSTIIELSSGKRFCVQNFTA